ncbi:BamA/OMP85 family outer membrane protein [Longimicrobium sp.]|uniref:BamA/OMP85 family outer membrane protein n=1 Tax=Longimicrobium sp. TaxID=2029185 RepID=UPI002D7F2FE1|nr:POTRA domain-containing protein [Longimicrobium sp.]
MRPILSPFPSSAALVAMLLSAAPLAAQTRATQVRDIDVRGTHALGESQVRAVIQTPEPRCRSVFYAPACALGVGGTRTRAPLDTIQVREDVARIDSLYQAWGYLDVRTTSSITPSGDGVEVAFTVAEGEPVRVRTITVQGFDLIQPPIARPALVLRPGDPYSIPLLQASERRLANAAAERGYAFASVEASGTVDRTAHLADVVLTVVPGPVAVFGTTTVAAEPPLRERDVLSRLAYEPGERFAPSRVRRTQERLYALPIVQEARVEPVPAGGGDTTVNLRVAVTPTRVGAFQLEGVASSTTCIGAQGYASTRYAFGAPRVITVSAGGSNLLNAQLRGFPCTGGAGGEFSQPDWFVSGEWREPVGAETWLLVNAAVRRESSPRAYARRGVDGRLALARHVATGIDVVAGIRPERGNSESDEAFFCGVYGACSPSELAPLTAATTIIPAELEVSWQPPGARRTTFGPVEGPAWDVAVPLWFYGARLSLSGAPEGAGSDVGYARAVAQGNVARRLGARTEVAARARVGVLAGGGGRLPPHLRLFGGGPLGVRGVPANLLGPRLLEADTARLPAGCTLVAGGCDGVRVGSDTVGVRSTGGTAVVETSAEARWWAARRVMLAAFVDWGAVRASPLDGAPAAVRRTESLATPGVGVQVVTSFGAVRVDAAYDPSPARRYPLLARDPSGSGYLFLGDAVYDPYGGATGWSAFRRRIQLQLTMGGMF